MAPHRLAVETLVALVRGRASSTEVMAQVQAAGVEGLLPVLVLGLLAGGVGVGRAAEVLAAVGGQQQLSEQLMVLLIRDAGPLLTALFVLVRSGASVAVDVGSAKGPPGERALPRILGLQLSILGLYVFFSASALVGAGLGASLALGAPLGLPGMGLEPLDLVLGSVRCGLFAALIGLLCSAEGIAERPLTVAARRATLGGLAACILLEGALGTLFGGLT